MAASKLELLESRVATLEAEITKLKQQAADQSGENQPWWEQRWGTFDDYPDYEKVAELGRQYRESQRPKPAKSSSRKKTMKKKSVKNGRG